MPLALALFLVGMLTILLPCILPLVPIVLGVSVTGGHKLRPLMTVAGMLVSFVGFTFVLQILPARFAEGADILRVATYYILLLFGLGFLTHHRWMHIAGALAGSLFFWEKGMATVIVAAILGIIAMDIGGRVAGKVQQLGSDIQTQARGTFGAQSPLTAFFIGLTLGLVWLPCAGPALGLVLALIRDEPGPRAAFLLFCYGLGTAVPLLLIGYGGQAAVLSVRAISPYTGRIKQIAGVFLILTAVALQLRLFEKLQLWLLDNTTFGDFGSNIEQSLFGEDMENGIFEGNPSDLSSMDLPTLPRLTRALELNSAGPWHNSDALTMAGLKGKVVLIDFWTYSCINCIRTLPYIQGYWEKFHEKLKTTNPEAADKFVIIGVHTPEFIFEKSEKNVADAITRHGLTYPVVQDNDFGTWQAFANRYWPAKYLIDAEGYIRYTHFGEGAYDETDKAIQSLLAEIGVKIEGAEESEESEDSNEGRREQSPETYVGERSWPALVNSIGDPTDDTVSYTAPTAIPLHGYALNGDWRLADGERQILMSDTGEIRMHWQGGEINLVLGPDEAKETVTGEVFIDGEKVKTITIDHYDLYNLYTGTYGEHELVLKLKGKGVAAYAFTFGG